MRVGLLVINNKAAKLSFYISGGVGLYGIPAALNAVDDDQNLGVWTHVTGANLLVGGLVHTIATVPPVAHMGV